RDPFQSRRAASVQPHPLTFVIVHTDGHTHPARAKLKRHECFWLFALGRFQQSYLLCVEVNLHDSTSKEVCANETVYGPFTRTAQLGQIDGQILPRQFHLADLREHSLLPVAGEHGSDTVNHDLPAKL